jgi:hypothetical protein
MKTVRAKYLWFCLALLLPLLAAGVFFGRDWLLDDLLRPRLAAMAGEGLSAEVTIGRLVWRDGGLLVSELQVRRPHHYRLAVPRLRFELSLFGLLRRHLAALEITSPDLLLEPFPDEGAAGFPSRPPISIDRLTVYDGRIVFQLPEKRYEAKGIHFHAAGGEPYDFALAASAGAPDGAAVHLSGRAEWRQGLAVTLDTFQWNERQLLASPLDFTISPGGGPAAGGRLRLARLDRAALEGFLAGLPLRADLPEGWDFALQGLELGFSLAGNRLTLGLQVEGLRFFRGGLNVPLTALNLDLSGSGEEWQGRAQARLADDNPLQLTFSSKAGVLDGRLLATVAEPGRLKMVLTGGEAPALAGGLQVDAAISGTTTAPAIQVDIKGFTAVAKGSDFLLNLAPLHLRGRIGRTQAGWGGQGRLLLGEGDLLQFEGDPDKASVKLRPVALKQLRLLFGPRLPGVPLQEAEGLRGDLKLARNTVGTLSGSVRLAAGRVLLADNLLTGLTADLDFAAATTEGWFGSLALQGEKLAVADLSLENLTAGSQWRLDGTRLTFSKASAGARLSGSEQFSASLALAGSGSWQEDGWHVELANLAVENAELLSADGLAGLSGGRLKGKGSLDGAPDAPLRLTLNADLGVSEGLWGPYYADLSAVPASIAVRLDLDPATRRVKLDQLQLTLSEIGRLQAAGTVTPDVLNLAGELDLPDLAGPLTGLLRATLGESHTLLKEIHLAGALRTTLSVAGQADGWRIRGEALPTILAVEVPEAGVSLAGATGNLPFELTFGAGAPARQGEDRLGILHFETLQLGPVSLAAEAIRVLSAPDRLAITTPLVLQLAGGRMTIDGLTLGRDREGVNFEGMFTVAGIELESLSRQLELPPMQGSIDADLGRIHYAGGVLRSAGEARIDVFGGRIRIRNIRLDASSLAYLQTFADVDFTAIDLYQLTQTFSFGVMNGIVDGHVRELRLFGATPARFSARLESRDQGKRNISVKALNNLTILSQGGLSAALSRGVYRFIDFYRYRKIGIVCELEKDVFHLRGTARPDSDRYLVYGGFLPPKIDIVAPPAAISFSEMLKRLQRIERAERR